jgi:hypothetical protein
MAKHRLGGELAEREFQGLTIAVSRDKIAFVKERLRTTMLELATELSGDAAADDVLRVELCAFFVTK